MMELNLSELEHHLTKKNYLHKDKKFRILYVSKIEFYKNQIDLLKVANLLRKKNYNFELTFVGPAYEPALKQFLKDKKKYDPRSKFIKYLGNQSFKNTLKIYNDHDLHVVPSTCETFGQIVLEAMACGIPNACSDIEVFKEITNNNAKFFRSNNIDHMVKAIEQLMFSNKLRYKLAINGINNLKKKYCWKKTSSETFKLLN